MAGSQMFDVDCGATACRDGGEPTPNRSTDGPEKQEAGLRSVERGGIL